MNAIDLLKADHDRVEQLFERFKKNEDGSHAMLFKQIRNELETHTHIEEAIFYPAALKRGKADLKKIIREGLEEHAQVKDLLADLSKMTSRNKQFNAKLKVVVENVEHHVEEEEDEMFPLAEDQFTDTQLKKLGAEMEAEKKRFQKKHGIKPAPANPSMIDRAKAVVAEFFAGSGEGEPQKRPVRAKAATANGKAASTSSNGKGKGKSSGKARAKKMAESSSPNARKPSTRSHSSAKRLSR